MRNLKTEIIRLVREELNNYYTGPSILTEIGDGSAKPYKFSNFNPNLGDVGTTFVKFKTDSGLIYSVELSIIFEGYLNVGFTANGTYDITNKGEMYRVMATLIAIIERVFRKTVLEGISYSPYAKGNDEGKGRDRLYRLFIISFSKKYGLKVVFDDSSSIIFVQLQDPNGSFLIPSIREKLLNPGKHRITKKELDIKGDLDLSVAPIKTLPKGLRVGGDLSLDGCASLISLPKGLQVGKFLSLTGCTSLKSLPDDLQVGINLYLGGCISLTSLPNNLHVKRGNLYLKETPLAKKYSAAEIRTLIEAKGGYVKGTIYV